MLSQQRRISFNYNATSDLLHLNQAGKIKIPLFAPLICLQFCSSPITGKQYKPYIFKIRSFACEQKFYEQTPTHNHSCQAVFRVIFNEAETLSGFTGWWKKKVDKPRTVYFCS